MTSPHQERTQEHEDLRQQQQHGGQGKQQPQQGQGKQQQQGQGKQQQQGQGKQQQQGQGKQQQQGQGKQQQQQQQQQKGQGPKPPLSGRYWFTVALVLLALVPDLIIASAMPLLRSGITRTLDTNAPTLAIAATFSNAGWAFGAVLAADLAQRFPERRLLILYESMFIIGSILGAVAPSVGFIIAGRILQGVGTGMMLIAALPPLIRQFPVQKLGLTALFTDLGLFGAVAAGPLVGGWVAQHDMWRWFFAATGLLGVFGLLLIVLVVQLKPGYSPGRPIDFLALGLTAAGSGLTFWGVGNLNNYNWTSPWVWAPTAAGLICIAVVIVTQYLQKQKAFMPVKLLSTTFPVAGIVSAIFSGAAYTGSIELIFLFMQQVRRVGPMATGLLFWSGLVMALVGSVLFGLYFASKYILVLPMVGMMALAVATYVLTTVTVHTGNLKILWLTALLGFGEAVTVSPGLFMAALAVKPQLVGRAFALVEMLRLAGAFAMVPAFVYFAQAYGMTPPRLILGLHTVYWVIFIIMVVAMVFYVVLFLIGGAKLRNPDLQAYVSQKGEAFQSPPVAQGLRD